MLKKKQVSMTKNEKSSVWITSILSIMLWPIPVLGSFLINLQERKMILQLLEENSADPRLKSGLFWKFHLKNIPLLIVTYIPIIGPPFQAFEVWQHARFTVNCIREGITWENRKTLIDAMLTDACPHCGMKQTEEDLIQNKEQAKSLKASAKKNYDADDNIVKQSLELCPRCGAFIIPKNKLIWLWSSLFLIVGSGITVFFGYIAIRRTPPTELSMLTMFYFSLSYGLITAGIAKIMDKSGWLWFFIGLIIMISELYILKYVLHY